MRTCPFVSTLGRAWLVVLLPCALTALPVCAAPTDDWEALVLRGEFSQAERVLRKQVTDLAAPVVDGPAVQLEILRRTRLDFPYNEAKLLKELRKEMPIATLDDVRRWTASGELQHRMIDGKVRYFRRAVGNLFRFSDEAKASRKNEKPTDKGDEFSLPALLAEIVEKAEQTDATEIYPVIHTVTYTLEVRPGHPRLQRGAVVRAWLPYPQEYRQQRDVKLMASTPEPKLVAPEAAPQRTIYYEQRIKDAAAVKFQAKFQFVTSAYYPRLDYAAVRPYNTQSELYKQFTAERDPHIVFTPQVRRLVTEIVGEETNPLKKAERIFRWISANLPWSAEMEYSIIPNLSDKGLTARGGDCGVQGMSFITLCRAAGVPARWQSGWQLKPGHRNMHDWSEFYVEPWGWLPADASYGLQKHDDPRVAMFLCGHLDPYRMIVNLDYARELEPPKTSYRSEPNDFQRGEVEIDGHNLYFDEWDYTFEVETEPVGK